MYIDFKDIYKSEANNLYIINLSSTQKLMKMCDIHENRKNE